MNIFDLDDKTRILILKILVATGAIGTLTNLWFLKKTVDNIVKLRKVHDRNVRKMRVAGKIIDRLMKEAGPGLIDEIVHDYEFDWIVADIDPEELGE